MKRIVRRILTADGSPHQVSLGVAIGTFIAFLPIPGLQMLLAGGLAIILRANKALSVSFVWITNAITSIPIFLFNYGLGCWLLRRDYKPKIFCESFGRLITRGGLPEKLHMLRSLAENILSPLWVGSMITASFLATFGYFAVRFAITKYSIGR